MQLKHGVYFYCHPNNLTKELFKQGVHENSEAVHIIDQFSWCNSDMIVNKNVIVIIKTC